MNNATKKRDILLRVQKLILEFHESETRMNYGHIGNLKDALGEIIVVIFGGCFYVHSSDFALNNMTLQLIKDIQVVFEKLEFENRKPIIEKL